MADDLTFAISFIKKAAEEAQRMAIFQDRIILRLCYMNPTKELNPTAEERSLEKWEKCRSLWAAYDILLKIHQGK